MEEAVLRRSLETPAREGWGCLSHTCWALWKGRCELSPCGPLGSVVAPVVLRPRPGSGEKYGDP